MNEVPTNWPRERTVPAWIPSAPMKRVTVNDPSVKPNRLMDRLKQIFESRTKLCKFRIIKKPAAGSNGIQALNIIKPNGEGRSNYNVQRDKSDESEILIPSKNSVSNRWKDLTFSIKSFHAELNSESSIKDHEPEDKRILAGAVLVSHATTVTPFIPKNPSCCKQHQPLHSRFALLSTYCEIMDTLTSLLESHPDTITSKCKPVKAFSVSQEYMTFLLELLDTPVATDDKYMVPDNSPTSSVASFNTCSESLKTFVLGSPALLFRNESTLLHSVSELE